MIDLTMPIRENDGRYTLRNTFYPEPHAFDAHGVQSSTFKMFAHFGTHVDAPRHFIRGGCTIDQVAPERLMGRGAVFDLSDFDSYRGIDSSVLGDRDPGLAANDIAILRTDWTDRKWGASDFHSNAPFLTGDAAHWLVDHHVKAVVYDFPEEEIIRNDQWDGNDAIVHHTLLGNDIYNIEYVVNLSRISAPFVGIIAMPLPLVALDGAPARVLAFEGNHALSFFASESSSLGTAAAENFTS
jgi:arylformamidase